MNKKQTVSVAMTTYNGEKYVTAQLQSLYEQTRRPDEVIICDDISSDRTVLLVKEFIEKYHLDSWHIFVNEKNLGWRQNFRNAISKTKGDIVFFADQDDIWFPNKIERMVAFMQQYDIGCLYGYAQIIDSDNNMLTARNEKKTFTGAIKKISFTPSFYVAGALGCCMCVSRRVIDRYLMLDLAEDDHDSQCPRLAVLYDTLYVYDAPVIYYRMHQNNTSGISAQYSYGSSTLERRVKDIEIILLWLKKVITDSKLNTTQRNYISHAIVLEEKRLLYLRDSQIPFIALVRYLSAYAGITMFLGDFAYKHNLNNELGKLRWKIKKLG